MHLSAINEQLSVALEMARQNERKIARMRDLYAALSHANRAIARIAERGALFREICRIAVEHGRFHCAWIGLLDQDSGQVIPAAGHGKGLDALRRLPVSTDDATPEGRGAIGAALRVNRPSICNDCLNAPGLDRCRDAAAESGFRSLASFPFQLRGQPLGVLNLYSEERDFFDEQMIGLLREMALDISFAIESRASEEKIRFLAYHDGLTSLPNRFLFREYLDLALRNAKRHGTKFAVLFLDLDRFKEINDTLGHDTGDQVLREIARRLRRCLREADKIARMGGDEFYVLIEELGDGRHAADVAQKLLDAASRPLRLGDKDCRLSVSIGISIYPDDGADGAMLLKNADCAMYRAKDRGKNGYRFFSPHIECGAHGADLPERPAPLHPNGGTTCLG